MKCSKEGKSVKLCYDLENRFNPGVCTHSFIYRKLCLLHEFTPLQVFRLLDTPDWPITVVDSRYLSHRRTFLLVSRLRQWLGYFFYSML